MKERILTGSFHFLIFSVESGWWYYLLAFAVLNFAGLFHGTTTGALIGGLIGLMLVDCFRAWEKQFKLASGESVSEPAPGRREFVDNAEAMLGLYQRNGYWNLSRVVPYYGKWINVSGKFDGASDSLQRDAVHLSLILKDGRSINLKFDTESRDRISRLSKGQAITVVAQVRSVPHYGAGYFSLENSEIVAAVASRPVEHSMLSLVS